MSQLKSQWKPSSSNHLSPVPRSHPNSTIVIIAGGPSVTQEDVNLTKDQIVIAINDSYQLAPWATYLYFCDRKWWEWHKDKPEYIGFEGIKITQDNIEEDVIRISGTHKPGLSESPDLIHYGSNSGFQALNLAVLLGAKRILLLGYDMKIASNGAAHWFGDHPDKVRSNYPSWLSNYSIAADQLKGKVKVINCSMVSALQCFPKMRLSDAIR